MGRTCSKHSGIKIVRCSYWDVLLTDGRTILKLILDKYFVKASIGLNWFGIEPKSRRRLVRHIACMGEIKIYATLPERIKSLLCSFFQSSVTSSLLGSTPSICALRVI